MAMLRLKSGIGEPRLLRLAVWSLTGLGGYVFARFVVNVFVARMLTPSEVGVMVLVTSIRLGFELLSDIGIEHNIVKHTAGSDDSFLATAWSIQIARGAVLCLLFLVFAPTLSSLFKMDERYLFALALAPLITSLHSPSIFLMVRELKVKERSVFELKADLFSSFTTILLVFLSPSIWSLIIAQLLGVTFRSMLSYSLPRSIIPRQFSRTYALDIIRFGRWIALSSAALFLASNIDKVTLGALAPLSTLGLYGLARSLADVPVLVVRRLSYQVVFPSLSRSSALANAEDDAHSFASLRYRFVVIVAACAGTALPLTDIAVVLLYGARYIAAAPILSVLIIASWIAVVSNLNEATMLSAGRPIYESFGNIIRLAILATGSPWAYSKHGIVAAAGVFAVSEFSRYVVVSIGMRRTERHFIIQDIVATCVGCSIAGTVWAIRGALP